MAEKIGFIGLGIMGEPMARNLLAAGYELVIHNRSRDVVERLDAEFDAVTAASSPSEVGGLVSLVITMLPDSPDVNDVVFGTDGDGLIASMGEGDLLIDMSTIAPGTAMAINDALGQRGASALDAPVSGGDAGAIAGTLSIMVGGAEADFERAMPAFEVLGGTITHCGDAGAGQTVKACNQIAVAVNYAAASEALVLGAKAGVDPEKIIQVLNGGLAASRVMEMRGPTMIEGKFDPRFPDRPASQGSWDHHGQRQRVRRRPPGHGARLTALRRPFRQRPRRPRSLGRSSPRSRRWRTSGSRIVTDEAV